MLSHRVVVVNPFPMMQAAFRIFLENEPFDIVGEVSAIMDLPDVDDVQLVIIHVAGRDPIAKVVAKYPDAKILVIADGIDDAGAIRAGAHKGLDTRTATKDEFVLAAKLLTAV